MDLWNSRRSPALGLRGCVATTQNLASEAGLRILQQGGNAADAAIAAVACLNVTEPTSCGIGGDCFALYYDASTKSVKGLNGSGRSASALNLDVVRKAGIQGDEFPSFHPLTVTVPGAAAAWCDTVETWGRLAIDQVLAPAIELAEGGFPVGPVTAHHWAKGVSQLHNSPCKGADMLLNGKPPKVGDVMRLPYLAETFRSVAQFGKQGFYGGRVAKSIVDTLQSLGHVLTLEDLANHKTQMVEPISVEYHGVTVHEIPPNGQGLTALMALNTLSTLQMDQMKHNSTEYLHAIIESLRIAFADTRQYIADPDVTPVPVEAMLSKKYAAQRAALFNPARATVDVKWGSPAHSSDTVYLSTADRWGNACSFICSNYEGFGTGILPPQCGFTLQNRGHNFSLKPSHPNFLTGGKRPYHTIIPGMATDKDGLYASFGVMGGFMQPQGHVQVLLNMIDHGMNPQVALDAPRVCIQNGTSAGQVCVEDGIATSVVDDLKRMGHDIRRVESWERSVFGRGQIIRGYPDKVWCAGSDPRADGSAQVF